MRTFCAGIVALVGALLVSGCAGSTNRSPTADRLQGKLAAAIQEKGREGEDARVDIKSVTDFAWDKMYIFPPYATTESIRRTIGEDNSGVNAVNIEGRDDINLLVFIDKGKVVQYAALPRRLGDFSISNLRKQQGFTPGEAVFQVMKEKDDENKVWLTLYQ
jgi:hypothetical protein